MKTADDRIDLSPLDPENDPDRLDRVVSGVLARLGPGLVEKEPSLIDDVSLVLFRHARALCAAAALVALISSALLIQRSDQIASRAATSPGVGDPSLAWSSWVSTGQPPSTEDLLLSFSGGSQ